MENFFRRIVLPLSFIGSGNLKIGKIREDVNGISGYAPSVGNQLSLLQKNRDVAENVFTGQGVSIFNLRDDCQ
jgi:hypothetical protein